jgi:hypothetical protein
MDATVYPSPASVAVGPVDAPSTGQTSRREIQRVQPQGALRGLELHLP